MRVALLSQNARAGDAIGNLLADKLTFFLDRGADVRVFVEDAGRIHPAVQAHGYCLEADMQFLSSADLLIVEYGQYYRLLELLPLLVGGKPRILFDYHGVTPTELWPLHQRENLEKGARQRGLVWCADLAVVHSRFAERELRQHTSFPRELVRVLPHSVDTQRFSLTSGLRDLRAELGIGNASILLFVGRLAANKRVPVMVNALDRLRGLSPPVHAVIVGDAGDVYQAEVQNCRQRADELGVANRLHFLGHVPDADLADIYRSADIFVMPSVHEGFCIPVLEAMACGTPVVVARSTALPGTVGDAGLTFVADDPDDLARQVRRVFAKDAEQPKAPARLSVGIVAFRYGPGVLGGAETSLRTIATSLHAAGHHVEVFTTCSLSEEGSNDLSPGTSSVDGIPVHRFRLDTFDQKRRENSLHAVLRASGRVPLEQEREYLANLPHCTDLLGALTERVPALDAVITGPYLNGLTLDVAQAFPDKTVLLPCFHDEPLAYLQLGRQIFENVGSILYHSPEEQVFAQADIGLNHPYAVCLGTWLDVDSQGDAEKGRALVAAGRPYLVYCGRYSAEKNLPELLDYLRRYQETHADRFKAVFLGQGAVAIPRQDWAIDLGFVDEQTKRDVLAGAAALMQLSRNESLSLVALEAWAQGIPVIADQHCPVLAGRLERCRGGEATATYTQFAAALDNLWGRPQEWRVRGQRGQAYVHSRFGSRTAFVQTLETAIRGMAKPLRQQLCAAGLRRAAEHSRTQWREQFDSLVELLLDSPPRPYRQEVVVQPRGASRAVSLGTGSTLIPVRVTNRGTHCVVADGPARWILSSKIIDEACPVMETPLPGLLMPGEQVSMAARVHVPDVPGVYSVELNAEHVGHDGTAQSSRSACTSIRLTVNETGSQSADSLCEPLLQSVRQALVSAERRQQLPDDYLDVSEGWLAAWKRWLKRKLLGNFKRAYVDVLSRQQSSFNREVVAAIQELAECCGTLGSARVSDSSLTAGNADELALFLQGLKQELADSRQRCAALEERLARLEARELTKEKLRL